MVITNLQMFYIKIKKIGCMSLNILYKNIKNTGLLINDCHGFQTTVAIMQKSGQTKETLNLAIYKGYKGIRKRS
jgi:hypothetical protein